MSTIDQQYKAFTANILSNGELRHSRSGNTISVPFPEDLRIDVRKEFPLLTCKSVPMSLVAGELLWFLAGKTDLHSLRMYQFGSDEGQNTIWTADYERYSKAVKSLIRKVQTGELQEKTLRKIDAQEDLGMIYGSQWREFESCDTTCDQITRLIQGIKENPASRYHIVSAWNPVAVANNLGALPPCHMFFQVYASEGGYMDLRWYQRSVDTFLGLPFNIASYALLLRILAQMTGYTARYVIGSFGDAHIYENHVPAVMQMMDNPEFDAPTLKLDNLDLSSLDSVLKLNGLVFKNALQGYQNAGVVKAPLSVG